MTYILIAVVLVQIYIIFLYFKNKNKELDEVDSLIELELKSVKEELETTKSNLETRTKQLMDYAERVDNVQAMEAYINNLEQQLKTKIDKEETNEPS